MNEVKVINGDNVILFKNWEENAVIRVAYEGTDMSVGIYDIVNPFDKDAKTVWGVNWSAMGTTKVEDAEKYIKLIKIAIKIAKEQSV